MEVGFIGLGNMGAAMARNVAMAGHRVRAWNRSAGAPIEGVERVATPRDAMQVDVALTMLSDDGAIRDVLLTPGVLGQARPGLVHAVMSTISIAFAEELRRLHEAAGLSYVSAPVFGRPDVAAAGKLNVVAAGAPAAIETARPVLEAIGQKLWVLGDDPKQANAAKIAGNMMIAMAIEAMAEALVLTGNNGVAPDAFFELVVPSMFGGRAYETYSAKIASGDYEPAFKARLGLKDLRLAEEAAAGIGKRLPMLDAVHARMAEAVESGLGDRDWSAMADYTLRR
jgi:3-hydroxyisobutyrate dehydrogenase-like beta-hydroxyacid dehydrogenase